MRASSVRQLRLPCYGIIIRLHREGTSTKLGTGTISSDLKEPVRTAADSLYHAAIDGLESLILAHACAGVDVQSPAYLEGIETAVDAVVNHFG